MVGEKRLKGSQIFENYLFIGETDVSQYMGNGDLDKIQIMAIFYGSGMKPLPN